MEMNTDAKTLQRLEQELDTKIYPGTEIMSDVGDHHFVKSGKSAKVLVPQPSADPHDPLNWNRFWKTSAMTMTTLVSFAQGFGPLSLGPMFVTLMEEFDTDLAGAVQFVTVCILVLGFSNFLWVPIQTVWGRRPVLIFSSLVCFASNVWRARATTYASFMGACILNGIGAGPSETAQPTITADIMFLHERGAYNTLYFSLTFGSLMIGPVVSGAITEHSHWRNFWWLNAALHAAVAVGCVFLFPETKWHRVHPQEMSSASTPPVLLEKNVTEGETSTPSGSDKGNPHSHVEAQDNTLTTTTTADLDPYLHKGTPSRQQFGLFQSHPNALKAILLELWIPWRIFTFPIVEFASFVTSWSASSFLVVNLTQSQIFAAPPYNFSSQQIGFTNFAILAGAMIGLATNGPLSDWVAARATKKNGGIREPEMRLPALIPYVLVMILGNFMVAFGGQYSWPWEPIVIIGFACAGMQVATIPAIVSTYAVDSYKPVAGSIFVTITINKNLWGYGFGKVLTPWIIESGYLPPIMMNMCLITFFCSTAIIFYFYGKKMRGWSKDSSVHSM